MVDITDKEKIMYKIVGIYNRGEERTPKTNGRYPLRVGRIVSAETVMFATVGSPLILQYEKDEHGNDYKGYYLRCSRLYRKSYIDDYTVELETQNTVYVLKKVKM